MKSITANVIRELAAFLDNGLQIRCLPKRKYRLNDSRIKRATQQFQENGENAAMLLDMVSHTVQGLVSQALNGHTEDDLEEEEPVLTALDGEVPVEFAEVAGNL